VILLVQSGFAAPYDGMRVGEGINIPVQNNAFPDHLGVLIKMMPFHKIANEITYDDLFIITREIYMGQVIHVGLGYSVRRAACKDIILFKTLPAI